MKLINTKTLKLETFPSASAAPAYAILSHTWGTVDEEVTLQEMVTDPRSAVTIAKIGYKKIEKTCEIARQYHLEYAWVDTCCIDKTSSSELTEAINSMYKWYGAASTCFAFLSDIFDWETFDTSRWFTRGWTLQELVAPSDIIFFDGRWNNRGTKYSLNKALQRITGIPGYVLEDTDPMLKEIPVAVRMSWAASRQTTREEDLAYCLLGIFDINMPMLYGEGSKAFIRLQEQIIAQCKDSSIFVWQDPGISTESFGGILAPSPHYFRHWKNLQPELDPLPTGMAPTFALSNLGVNISTRSWFMDTATTNVFLPLGQENDLPEVGIYVQKVDDSTYVRSCPHTCEKNAIFSLGAGVFSGQFAKSLTAREVQAIGQRRLVVPPPSLAIAQPWLEKQCRPELVQVEPHGCWNPSTATLFLGYSGVSLGYFHFKFPEGNLKIHSFYLVCLYRHREWTCALIPQEEFDKLGRRVSPSGSFLPWLYWYLRHNPECLKPVSEISSFTFTSHQLLSEKGYRDVPCCLSVKQSTYEGGEGCVLHVSISTEAQPVDQVKAPAKTSWARAMVDRAKEGHLLKSNPYGAGAVSAQVEAKSQHG